MKRLLLISLFVLALGFALFNYKGLATQGTYNSLVLDFREDVSETVLDQKLQDIAQQYDITPQLNSEFSTKDNLYIVNLPNNGNSPSLVKSLQQNYKNVTEYIEPNYTYHSLFRPNDPDYSKQWNLQAINIEPAWDDSTGEGVTVAVIDTGVTKVPDLKETKIVKGYDFVNDQIEAIDDVGHGTHVAGTIAQSTHNQYGVAGIAYNAKIMPIKVLGVGGGGTVSDIAEGIRYAADHGADVINLSLGGSGESAVMAEAINYAYAKDVAIIAAAGNENRNSASYPARYPKVFSVSALDAAQTKAPYSNFGAGVDIAAPGGSDSGKIIQNTIDPREKKAVFAGYQGTSMASPHVAGVAALIKAVGVSEPEQVYNILKESARAVEEDPLNHYGAGQLDASEAVKLALKGKITFKDFFRWLRDSGYLNPRFWIDGGAVALLPKLAMVIGSYLLAWFLRNYFPFRWSWSLSSGLVAGSSGLFFLQCFYIFDLPHTPFRVLGSSIPELGNAWSGSSALNPLFASVLIPLALILLFLGHPQCKWFAIGSALGVSSCLAVSAILAPEVWGLGAGVLARCFLLLNAVLCFALARLVTKDETSVAS